MHCKSCGQAIDEMSPITKETFSPSERVTEVVCGVFTEEDGTKHLVLKEPFVETFEREIYYTCGYCGISYTKDELITLFTRG